MQVIDFKKWYFPPTLTKKGVVCGGKFDDKTVYIIKTTLFDSPVIAMSDIHSQTTELNLMLDELVDLDAKVLIFIPESLDIDTVFKTELNEQCSPLAINYYNKI